MNQVGTEIPTKVVHGCTVKVDSLIKYVRSNNRRKCGVMYAEKTHGYAGPFAVVIGWSQDTRLQKGAYISTIKKEDGCWESDSFRTSSYPVEQGLSKAVNRAYEVYPWLLESTQLSKNGNFALRPQLQYYDVAGIAVPRPKPPRLVRDQLPAFIRQVRQEFRVRLEEIYIADMDVDIQQEIMKATHVC